MRLTEQQYNEIIKNPVGVGTFIYRSSENEVSQLQAKRPEMTVYRRAMNHKKLKKKKAIAQSNYDPLLKAVIIGAIGIIVLIMGH